MVWCGVVWCGVVWCGVVWCGVWCGVVWYGMVWYGMVHSHVNYTEICHEGIIKLCFKRSLTRLASHIYKENEKPA